MRVTRPPALAAAIAVLAAAGSASAYCRTTTCDVGQCSPDPACQYCLVGGKPLFWAGGCMSFSVHELGSPLRGIDAAALKGVVSDAFSAWISVDCGGSQPDLGIYDVGLSSCGVPVFNDTEANANVWMFRDDTWPHPSSQLALTTVTFDTESGRIYDADVELNSVENEFTVGDSNVVYDLRSIVVHEAGHFLGLAHSCTAGATMEPTFAIGDMSLRTLETDDANAICEVYPPGSADPNCDQTPYNGLATACSGPGGSPGTGGSSGGSSGTGPGTGGSAGTGAVGTTESPASKGCSCRLPGGRDDSSPAIYALLSLLSASLLLRTRRSR